MFRGVHPSLIEFPADDPERALRFWRGLLGVPVEPRSGEEGSGWQTRGASPDVGVHERGRGPGDRFSLPYFEVEDVAVALERVTELGGSVVHPGESLGGWGPAPGPPSGRTPGRWGC
jgi:predicted enzyme related to lactoylglutathione lyase